ncbi:MAG: TolC family protein [Saprospiraceae bacterium]|nr:TolC family protein [Saprospiraceae bacterium]MCB9324687.1 TolC family protein [Lewinellaceae bacterium]
MMRKILLITAVIFFVVAQSSAQQSWSLEKCINHALENNLMLKMAETNIAGAELNLKQDKAARMPRLSASTNAGLQLGRTIDPTTNAFDNQTIGFNTFGLNASATLYNGNAINNSIKKSNLDLEAARLDGQKSSNDLALSVANAYLSILLADEQLRNTEKRLELSREQLAQTDKLIQAGSLPENNRLDFLSRIAQDEQLLIEAQNLLATSYLNIKQLLELEPGTPFDIAKPSVSVPVDDPDQYKLEEVYATALGLQPGVRAAELRIESAHLNESIAKAGLLPSVSVFGGLSANYSSISKDYANPDLSNATLVQGPSVPVIINGEDATVSQYQYEGIIYPEKPYFNQLSENFGQNIGINISIPIYSNGLNRINLQRARLNSINQEIGSLQTKNNLKADIQLSISNARSGKRSYQAALRSLEAAQAAYENAKKRFDLGSISTFEFSTARNTFDQAEVSLIRAKYQYIFFLKVVDFYLGKEIVLD